MSVGTLQKGATTAKRALPEGNEHRRTLWYVPHEKIETQDAAWNATTVVSWITSADRAGNEPAEKELFSALHTCAYRAGTARQPAEREQWKKYWRTVREYLVEKNLGLVHVCIRRFQSRSMDTDDVFSEAICALSRSIDRFNPWKGFRFSTYACNVIFRALMRRGKSESRYRNLFPVQHDSEYERPVDLPDDRKELRLERLRITLERNLGSLTQLEAKILSHRFCEDPESELTYQEIGKLVGLGKERVRQIQNIALAKLREAMENDPLLK